jgi:hypothetical protein
MPPRAVVDGREVLPAVVLPLTARRFPMLRRKPVCTGMTRGKRLVVIVGRRRALAGRGGDAGRR